MIFVKPTGQKESSAKRITNDNFSQIKSEQQFLS